MKSRAISSLLPRTPFGPQGCDSPRTDDDVPLVAVSVPPQAVAMLSTATFTSSSLLPLPPTEGPIPSRTMAKEEGEGEDHGSTRVREEPHPDQDLSEPPFSSRSSATSSSNDSARSTTATSTSIELSPKLTKSSPSPPSVPLPLPLPFPLPLAPSSTTTIRVTKVRLPAGSNVLKWGLHNPPRMDPSLPTPTSPTESPSSWNECTAEQERQILIPPENFAMVLPGLYRSSFPNEDNFNFLSTLKLKSVLFVPFSSYLTTSITDAREKKNSSARRLSIGQVEFFSETRD